MAAASTRSGRIILAAVLAIFVYGLIAAMVGTLLPTYNFNGEQSGNIGLLQAFGLIIASLAAGPFIDIRGKKPALLTALGLIAIALLFLANTGGVYSQVLAAIFLLNLGGGILVTAANSLAGAIDEQRRGTMLNFLNLFFGLGGLLTPFIAANLVNNNALQLCYLVAGLSVVALAVNASTPIPAPTGERGFQLAEVGTLLGRPALWLLSLFLFLYVAAEIGMWNWLATYLTDVRKIDKKDALNILSLGFALGLLVGRVVVSRVLIRVPAVTVTLASAVLMALTTFLMLQVDGSTAAAVAVFCAGLAMAPVFPTTLAMVGDAFPRGTATAMGIAITFGWVGLAVSSPIIGQIAGADKSNLSQALLVLPAVSVLMVLVNLALRPMLRKA